jgi:hypothetical protein
MSEVNALKTLRETTLAHLSQSDYERILKAVEIGGIESLTGTAAMVVKSAVLKHGSHDQSSHNPKKGGGGGGSGGGSSAPTKEPQDAGQRMWDTENTLRTANSRDTIGTSRQGGVTATREQLTEALGNPQIGGMDKSTIGWGVVDRKTGVVATVYDWKRSPESGSRSEYATKPPEMGAMLEYEVGGTKGAVDLVFNALFQAKRSKANKSAVTKHGSHDQSSHNPKKGGGGMGGGGSATETGSDKLDLMNQEIAAAKEDVANRIKGAESQRGRVRPSGSGTTRPQDSQTEQRIEGTIKGYKDAGALIGKPKELGTLKTKMVGAKKDIRTPSYYMRPDNAYVDGYADAVIELHRAYGNLEGE